MLTVGVIFSFAQPRKTFFSEQMGHCHLTRCGGPGAPHLFRFDRIGDIGLVSHPLGYAKQLIDVCIWLLN